MLPAPSAVPTWATPNSSALQDHRGDPVHAAQQAAQDDAAEHDLLDDRGGDDGGDGLGDDVGPVEVDVADVVDVARQRDAQRASRRSP